MNRKIINLRRVFTKLNLLNRLFRHDHYQKFQTVVFTQDEKSYLPSHWHPVPKCKCRECNTFAMVRIHVQMFQAMSVKRYPLTNVSIFHYTWCNFAFESWHHKNYFQIETICVLSCWSHLHMNSHYSKCVAFAAFAFWHRVPMWVQIWFFILCHFMNKLTVHVIMVPWKSL